MRTATWGVAALLGGVVATSLWALPATAQDEQVVVLEPVGESPGPEQDPTTVAGQVDKLAKSKAMGKVAATLVVDANSGTTLYDDDGSLALVPASANKIITAAAVLRTAGADRVLQTTTTISGGEVFIVGGGDPLLSSRRPVLDLGHRPYPRFTPLRVLAKDTAAALKERGTTSVRLKVDDTFFTGPDWGHGWPEYYRTDGIAAPVSALLVDQGRVQGTGIIAEDPGQAGGDAFAKLLRSQGITVTSVAKQKSPQNAEQLAAINSAPINELVGEALLWSDNETAESLFRLAGEYGGFGASFEGGGQAVAKVLTEMGISPIMAKFYDGSGLSPEDRVSPAVIVDVLRRAVTGQDDLWPIASGLAVAGVTGTLQNRFDDPESSSARGWARAKTGTLNYVSALAGYVQSRSGRVLIFTSLANEAKSSFDAAAAMDKIVGRVTDCGCPGTNRDTGG